MIIDDELSIRTIIARFLKRAGYDAVLFEDGLSALEWIKENPQSIDCVLIDMSMPTISGPDTAYYLQLQQPRLPIIFMSGYDTVEIRQHYGDRIAGVLQKPFVAGDLLAVIDQAIQR